MTRKEYDQETARRLYLEGTPIRQIALLLGVPATTLHRHLKNVEKPNHWDLERAIEMYSDGATLIEIADVVDVCSKTVKSRLVAAGVVLRGKKKTESTKQKLRAHRDYEDIPLAELSDAGCTTQEIANMYGKDPESVRRAMKSRGIPRQQAKARREKNPFWRGGYQVDRGGYILVHSPEHPYRTQSNYVRQHRLVMEEHLGRYLTPEEVVDHVNGDTSDNRIENLRLFPNNAEHLRHTLKNSKRVSPDERERLRLEAVQRGLTRVAAILEKSKTCDQR